MRALLLLAVGLAAGCAPGLRMPGPLGPVGRASDPGPDDGAAEDPDLLVQTEAPARRTVRRGERAARVAESLLGSGSFDHDGTRYRYDCSGFTGVVYAHLGWSLTGSSQDQHDLARDLGVFHRRKVPSPGDIAFFEDTWDRNGNRRVDDGITHVAVVVSTDGDGTVHLVHKGNQGVGHLRMNLQRPHDRRDDDGKELNGVLRVERRSDRPGTRYLAGELWAGFGSFWRVDAEAGSAAPPPPPGPAGLACDRLGLHPPLGSLPPVGSRGGT